VTVFQWCAHAVTKGTLRLVRPIAIVAVLVALCPLFSGCGSGGRDETQQVRATLAAFANAMAHKDYATLCTRVFAPALVARLTAVGLDCKAALARGLGGVKSPKLVVRSITVHGQTATAHVHTGAANQQSLDTTISLRKQAGHWYIAAP
jgi:ketosteroid isomerase-like protein